MTEPVNGMPERIWASEPGHGRFGLYADDPAMLRPEGAAYLRADLAATALAERDARIAELEKENRQLSAKNHELLARWHSDHVIHAAPQQIETAENRGMLFASTRIAELEAIVRKVAAIPCEDRYDDDEPVPATVDLSFVSADPITAGDIRRARVLSSQP